MPDHPLDAIFVTGTQVNKALVKTELKKYARDFVDAVTFRTYDLPGVPIAVIAGQLYLYDAADLITADNGTTCILDASSRRFKRQSAAVAGSTMFLQTALAGTVNALQVTTDAMATLSATRQFIWILPSGNNTLAVTIAFDGAAAVDLKSNVGSALAADELQARPTLLAVTSTDARIYSPW